MSQHKPKVITIVGAESSGKTTLASQLREHFDCPWVPEYAREYLISLGRIYNESDLEIIADRQFKAIQDAVRQSLTSFAPNPLAPPQSSYGARGKGESNVFELSSIVNRQSSIVILDGGMMNLRMWARIKYKSTIPIVENALKNDVTDLYLLCRPHVQWEADPLREAPSLIDRVWIYNQYLDELTRGEKPVEIISGPENERLVLAISAIENFVTEK